MDITTFQAAFAGLKSAIDIASSLTSIRDAEIQRTKQSDLLSKLVSMQDFVLSTREADANKVQRINDLERELQQLKAWDVDKARYELKKLQNGALVFALRELYHDVEPPHYLCPNCYHRGEKSILQPEHKSAGRVDVLVCLHCESEIIIQGYRHPETPRVLTRPPGR